MSVHVFFYLGILPILYLNATKVQSLFNIYCWWVILWFTSLRKLIRWLLSKNNYFSKVLKILYNSIFCKLRTTYSINNKLITEQFEYAAFFIRFENPVLEALLWIQYGDIWCCAILKVRQFDDSINVTSGKYLVFRQIA